MLHIKLQMFQNCSRILPRDGVGTTSEGPRRCLLSLYVCAAHLLSVFSVCPSVSCVLLTVFLLSFERLWVVLLCSLGWEEHTCVQAPALEPEHRPTLGALGPCSAQAASLLAFTPQRLYQAQFGFKQDTGKTSSFGVPLK